jgi:DNA-binding protein HU-alpha
MTIKSPKSASITKTPKKAAAAPLATVTTPEVVDSEAPRVAAPELRKKELIDTVVARSGIKKRDAKPVIEAMLAILGENVADGRDINIAPMGKIKVTRMKRTTKAQVITMRLRRSDNQQQEASDPIAQAAE